MATKQHKIPFPSVGFPKQVRGAMQENELAIQTFNCSHSGQITVAPSGEFAGCVTEDGLFSDLVVSVGNQGQDGVDDLILSVDLRKNGTSVLDSAVTITGASGEAGTAKVAAAPSFSTTSVARGDRLYLKYTLTRTTPVTEMSNLCVAIKIVPVLK